MAPNRKTLAELISQAGGEPSPLPARWAGNTRRAGGAPAGNASWRRAGRNERGGYSH